MVTRGLIAFVGIVGASVGCARARSEAPLAASSAASAGPRLTFVPEADSFRVAATEYTTIWATEGARIVHAMEAVSGLSFEDSAVVAIVYEGISQSGYRERPMRLRASYPSETKRATLIHELGHRLQAPLFQSREEEHPELFLWLYDVWAELYGREFADAQVLVERRRRGVYPAAWDQALQLTEAERAARWRTAVANRRK
jgi:hypothetical protein